MVIRITDHRANQKVYQYRLMLFVLNYIRMRPIKPQEKQLNDYLQENYKLNLTEAALLVTRRMKIQFDGGDTVIFNFMNKNFDNLAALITYGNGKFLGSSIIRDAFKKAERNM